MFLMSISVVAISKLCKAVLFVVAGVADASPQTSFATMFSSVKDCQSNDELTFVSHTLYPTK